ncbi:MAG TPA: Fic family protein [Candidatus Baltobacteraceae bacterium]|nr:Fic family protein [Candidatus Baltobacteraceae bacterium]
MAVVQTSVWAPRFELSGLPRSERKGCHYDAYIPDRLQGRKFIFGANEAADVSDAELAIARLNERAKALANTEALARLLLRAESVASSKIEGLEVNASALLCADAARQLGEPSQDVTAREVLSNIDAMRFAMDGIANGGKISLGLLLKTHELLLAPTRLAAHGGHFREQQNWIGGSDYNPCRADFVPPPPQLVHDLMVDLCEFSNDDALPAVAQAAIAHAQFETIHPFVDGNGRVGRVLIHLILRRRGLATTVSPPVSLVLATMSRDYVSGLTGTRYIGLADSAEAVSGINNWIVLFAAACRRAVAEAGAFEERISAIQEEWRKKLGSIRRNSAIDVLVERIPGAPIATVSTLAQLAQRSFQSVNEAMNRLMENDIVSPVRVGAQRNRVFEARDIIHAFTELELQLASPAGDTGIQAPARPVPKKRRQRST